VTDITKEDLKTAKALLDEGKYDESLSKIELILTSGIDVIKKLKALNLKSEICWRSGKLDIGLVSIKETKELLESEGANNPKIDTDLQKLKGTYFSHAGIIHWYLGNLETARKYHQESLKLNQDLENKEGVFRAYNNLGLVFWSEGNLDKATEYYMKSLQICEELGDENGISRVLNNLANISASRGELDLSLEYHQRSLAIKETIGAKQDIAQSLINMGVIYRLKGSFDKARDYYNRSLVIQEDLSIGPEFALALNNLGEIYSLTGELNAALEFYQRSFLIYESMGNKEGIALTLANIGEIYTRKNQSDLASEYFNRSLSISEEIGNPRLISTNLSELINVALDNENSELAEHYMTRFNQIREDSHNSVIDQKYRIASALILKKGKRMRDRVKAEEILEALVEEDISDHAVTSTAMIHLCHLLLDELKATGEEDTLKKIQGLTQKLADIARDQSSPILLVETYLLQSKLAIVELEFRQAQELMSKGLSIAENKGLNRLARIIEAEISLLKQQEKKLESILEKGPSKQEMIDIANLNELLERMVQKTVETMGIDSTVSSIKPKYELLHVDMLAESDKSERSNFRVGIAQIGLSHDGDILNELYEEKTDGFIGLREEIIEPMRIKIKEIVSKAHSEDVNILIFPEMSIDFNYMQLFDDVKDLAKQYEMIIIPGSFHNLESKENLCRVIGPDGLLWEQQKNIPAIIHIEGKRFIERLESSVPSKKIFIYGTEYGRIAITICRDFLDMDLRVALKNSEPPVDLIINPAFTPVTADFKAAHFDARRSIYAYCFFANIAEYGNSLIYSPEKDRIERTLLPKEEGLIVKEVNLFQLRSERSKWEKLQREQKSFIQSTRT